MDKRNMRIGDFVRDPEQNENLRVTLNEIEYSEIFEGIPLNRRFFDKNAFKVDTTTGNEVLYRQEGGAFVTADNNVGGRFYHSGNIALSGKKAQT